MKLDVFPSGLIDLGKTALGSLASENSLSSAVILSLLTDRRAKPDDRLPDDSGARSIVVPPDRRGWVGDVMADIPGDRFGSRLWLLHREKQTEETRRRAEGYALEALQWLIDDQIADSVKVAAEWTQMGRLEMQVDILLKSGVPVTYTLDNALGVAHAL